VQFNLERVGDDMKFDGLEADADPNPKSFVNFDIFLNIVESKDGLMLDCDYNTGLFDEATIARWLSHYQTLLLGWLAMRNSRSRGCRCSLRRTGSRCWLTGIERLRITRATCACTNCLSAGEEDPRRCRGGV